MLALGLGGVQSALAVALPLLLLGLGHGLINPPALAGTVSVLPALAGSAAAVAGLMQQLTGATGGYLVGLVSHDGAVHLCQFRKALRAVGRIEKESARADVENVGPVAYDNERAHSGLQDAIEALAQRCAGRDHSECMQHCGTSTPSHRASVPGGSFRNLRSCCRRFPRRPLLQPTCQPEWPSCLREDREQVEVPARA